MSHYLAHAALLLRPGPLPFSYPFAMLLFLSVLLHSSLALIPGSSPTVSVKPFLTIPVHSDLLGGNNKCPGELLVLSSIYVLALQQLDGT